VRGAVRGETRKLLTTRSLRGTLAAGGIVTVALAVFVGLTGSLQPDDTVLGGSLTGVVVAQLLAGVLGALAITSEHGTGTLAATVAAVPRRRVVLGAKAVVVGAATTVIGLVAATAAVVAGSALIDGDHAAGEPFPAVVGVALGLGAVALYGLALGTLVRHTGGAVAAVVGLVLLPQLLGPLFGDLQPWVTGLSPATALQKMTQTSDASAAVAGTLGPWPSLAVVGAVALVLLALADRALARRDL
jgi:ABC-2 type transport system permease protein